MLGKEDLDEFVGKDLYSVMWQRGAEVEELDWGTILKVTPGALHLDTSRQVRNFDTTRNEEYVDIKFTRVIPLDQIVELEIIMEE